MRRSGPSAATAAARARFTERPAERPAKRESPVRSEPLLTRNSSWVCPLCNQGSEQHGSRCRECGAIIELDDLQAIGRSSEVNHDLLGSSLKNLQRLVEHEPTAPRHKLLATIHLNLNNSSDALSHLSEAVRLAPDDAKLRTHLSLLKSQRIVLVVDSDEEVSRMAAEILEPYRLRVVAALNGLQTLSQVETEMPDLILLNMELPRMDGFEVCRILRKNAAVKDLPIIMLQDEGGVFGKLRGRLAGVADSVSKPLSAAVLREILKKHLPDSYLPDPELSSSGTFKL